MRTIQKLAGHARLNTTEVYVHLVSEVEEKAIRRDNPALVPENHSRVLARERAARRV